MLAEIVAPTICPECSGAITIYTEEKSGVTTHWCNNAECPGRIADMLTFVADRKQLEIEGLGPELASQLAREGYIVTLADLFDFTNESRVALGILGPEAFSDKMKEAGLPGAAVIRMIETTERAKTASWDRWLASLGIPMIGIQMGKTLAKELDLGQEDMAALPEKLALTATREIEGLGFHKKAELKAYSEDYLFGHTCRMLHGSGVRPTPIEKPVVAEGAPLAGMSICITGETYEVGSREYVSDHLTKLGAVMKSGVSKKVTHLLVGTEPGRTKLEKAKALNIPQLDEAWLTGTFTKHGISCAGSDTSMEWAD